METIADTKQMDDSEESDESEYEEDEEDESGFAFGFACADVVEERKVTDDPPPARLCRAESVLSRRSGRIALVLDMLGDEVNQQAVLRTADIFGVQYIYAIQAGFVRKNMHKFDKLTKGCQRWLTIRTFGSEQDCIQALQEDGREIWATTLSPNAMILSPAVQSEIPDKLALVIGRESDGVSPAMLEAASQHVFLPMVGFAESFNVSVATALALQALFLICPEARGTLEEKEKVPIREKWFRILMKRNPAKGEYWSQHASELPLLDDLRRHGSIPSVPKRLRKKIAARSGRPIIMRDVGESHSFNIHSNEGSAA